MVLFKKSIRRSQSAFSLIEVLVALLIVSVCVLCASKMHVQTMLYFREAELREKATILLWSMVDALENCQSEEVSEYWYKKFKTELPGSTLVVSRLYHFGVGCVYEVTVSFAASHASGQKPLAFTIGVHS